MRIFDLGGPAVPNQYPKKTSQLGELPENYIAGQAIGAARGDVNVILAQSNNSSPTREELILEIGEEGAEGIID